jgi:putative intracellular protease/amidase
VISSARRPSAWQAFSAAEKNERPCAMAEPGVMPTGGGPACRKPSSAGSMTAASARFQNGKPVATECDGQSACGAANHAGHAAITKSGECIQRLTIRRTGGRFIPARMRFSPGATVASRIIRSPRRCSAATAHAGSQARSPTPGSTGGASAETMQLGER